LIETEPKKAAAYLQNKKIQNEISYNLDNYFFLLAKLNYKSGNNKQADFFIKKSLEINPDHLESLALKSYF